MIRVLIVDDQALFRGGIRMLLESQPDMTCVGEAADGAQAVIIGGGPLTASALRLQPQFDIPLIVPVIAAAKAAAAAVTAN